MMVIGLCERVRGGEVWGVSLRFQAGSWVDAEASLCQIFMCDGIH